MLKNKVSIVTGCNRGIGKAILEDFAKHGSDVFAVIRKENAEFTTYCDSLSKQYQVEIQIVYADFEDEKQVKQAAKTILRTKKMIDVLVNNIGISSKGSMLAMTKMEDIREVFQVNFFSNILFTQLIARGMMKAQKGSIVFISSTAVFDAWSNIEYTSSKAAILGATRRLAIEYGNYNIRVNAVAPALTDTDMANQMSDEDTAIALNRNIMKRKGKPEEIADAVVFLASDMSSFITGQVMRVDGGLL